MTNKENLSLAQYPPKSLLLGLYHHSQQSKTTPFPYPNKYIELNNFRQKIEEEKRGLHHRPYLAGKKKAQAYRMIFSCIGLAFLFIFAFVYHQSANWSYLLIFDNWFVPKHMLCGACLILSAISFGICYSLRAEKEAVQQLVSRAHRKLKRSFAHKKAEIGKSSSHKMLVFRQAFHEAWEKINDSREVTIHLFEQIANESRRNMKAKEELFNQAILELNDKLQHILQKFVKTEEPRS